MRIKLGIPLPLSNIAEAIKGKRQCYEDPIIEYLSTDSREIFEGDLFVPIKGTNFNGENFVDEAIKKGALAISKYDPKAAIITNKNETLLLDLASFYIKKLPYLLYKIGITGSVGKTTTKEFAKKILSIGYRVHASEANLNNQIGMPLSILSAPKDTQVLLMEMGMNHSGEIGALSKCLCPDLAVITNIGSSHIGNLGSKEGIAKTKLEILEGIKDGRLYVLDEEELLREAKYRVSISLKNPAAEFYLKENAGRVAIYKNGIKQLETNFAFCEEHHLKCLLFASAIAIDTRLQTDLISQGISSISKDSIRQKDVFVKKYHIIDDSYNSSLESVIASINSLKKRFPNKRKSLLLGDVLELGKFSREYHRKIGEAIPPDMFCNLFLWGRYADEIACGAVENGFAAERIHINHLIDRPDITARQIEEYCQRDEVILFKASRAIRLERVIEILKEKQNE